MEIGAATRFSYEAFGKAWQLLDGYDRLRCLQDFKVPALIVTGRHDFIATPAHTQELVAAFSKGTLKVFEHSAHFPYAEEPETFATTLKDWLSEQ